MGLRPKRRRCGIDEAPCTARELGDDWPVSLSSHLILSNRVDNGYVGLLCRARSACSTHRPPSRPRARCRDQVRDVSPPEPL
jgi:hypothetical protein